MSPRASSEEEGLREDGRSALDSLGRQQRSFAEKARKLEPRAAAPDAPWRTGSAYERWLRMRRLAAKLGHRLRLEEELADRPAERGDRA